MTAKNANSTKMTTPAQGGMMPAADFAVEPIAGENSGGQGRSDGAIASASLDAGMTASEGPSTIEGFIDRQIRVIAKDLESLATLLCDATSAADARMGQGLRSTIEPLSGKIGQFADTLREQDAHRLVERTRELVTRHPMAIVGGVAVIAVALGQLAVMASRRGETLQ